ncbi:hypothetical protein GWI33_009912, partial [Rhynchophorus ferrugineus]
MNVRTSIDYKTIVDHLTTAVLLVYPDLTVHYINSSCETLFEISYLRIHKQPITQFVVLNDSSISFEQALNKTFQTGQPYTHREALLTIGLKDRYVDYTVSLVTTGTHQSAPLLLIEFQPIDRLLRISKEDLQLQQHQVARQLIRGVAHEIKNPLGGIRGATQLLARNVKDPHIS